METSPSADAFPRLCVLAAEPLLTVTIEASGHEVDVPDVHVHAGGQGLWISRMAASLGAMVTVCGPFGGETGGGVKASKQRGASRRLRVGSGSPGSLGVVR